MMDRATAITTLRDHESEIRARGVRSLALFGSVVRGEMRPDSDVDLLIDLDEDHALSLVDLMALRRYLGELLAAPADLAIRRNLKPYLRDNILDEAVPVF